MPEPAGVPGRVPPSPVVAPEVAELLEEAVVCPAIEVLEVPVLDATEDPETDEVTPVEDPVLPLTEEEVPEETDDVAAVVFPATPVPSPVEADVV